MKPANPQTKPSAAVADMQSAWGIDARWHRQASNSIDAVLWDHSTGTPEILTCGLGDDYLILSLHLSGLSFATVELDGRLRYSDALDRGSWMLVDTAGQPSAETQGKFTLLHVYVPKSLLKATCEDYAIEVEAPRSAVYRAGAFTDTTISQSAFALTQAAQASGAIGRLQVDRVANDLLVDLITLLHSGDVSGPTRLSPSALRRVQDYIAANLEKPITLDDLARAAGLSKYHFLRAFKADHGKTPMAALRETRLRKATELLIASKASITDIALQCGFTDHGHFSTAFRSHFDESPSRFRSRMTH